MRIGPPENSPPSMVRCILVLLAATSAASLVLTPAVRAPRSRIARMQFDDEGGMVKEIEEGGMSLEQVAASYGQARHQMMRRHPIVR